MREVPRESSCHRFGRWRRALRRRVGPGIGDAYGQSRHRSERSRARSKRALRVQSVSMPVAAELRLPPGGLLWLWAKLLWAKLRAKLCAKLCAKLLQLWGRWIRLRTRLARRRARRLVWRRLVRSLVVVRRPTFRPPLRLLPWRDRAGPVARALARRFSRGIWARPPFAGR